VPAARSGPIRGRAREQSIARRLKKASLQRPGLRRPFRWQGAAERRKIVAPGKALSAAAGVGDPVAGVAAGAMFARTAHPETMRMHCEHRDGRLDDG
jgi:hypothetical protein